MLKPVFHISLLLLIITTISCQQLNRLGLSVSPFSYSLEGTVFDLEGDYVELGLYHDPRGFAEAKSPIEIYRVQSPRAFQFEHLFSENDSYFVAITRQPLSPSQQCSLQNNSGTFKGSSLGQLQVNCSTERYRVSGNLVGLKGGSISLSLNGQASLQLDSDGLFSFEDFEVLDTNRYSVSVTSEPDSPRQYCTAFNNTGLVNGRDISDVTVRCSTEGYVVSGFISGLSGEGLELVLNDTFVRPVEQNSFFYFPRIADRSHYNVQVKTQPANPAQTCTVYNVPGEILGNGVADILVTCNEEDRSISGTVSGLEGSGMVLSLNGGNLTTVAGNGGFVFPDAVAQGSDYQISVLRQPEKPEQTCSVNNAAGTVGQNTVSNVVISCNTITYQNGIYVYGLKGTVALQKNSEDLLFIDSTGLHYFPERTADGGQYTIRVKQNPQNPRQICELAGAAGTISGSDSTTTFLTCEDAFSVGGTISGLSTVEGSSGLTSSGLVIKNETNGELLSLQANGSWTYKQPLKDGQSYSAAIVSQPVSPRQVCSFSAGTLSGTINQADVSSLDITCSTTVPALLSTSINPSSGTYNAGDTITITLTYDEPVVIAGPASPGSSPADLPYLPLNSGGSAVFDGSSEGELSETLTFIYTVGVEDNVAALEFSAADTVELNNSTLTNDWNTAAETDLPDPGSGQSIGDQAAIVIDDITPPALSIMLPVNVNPGDTTTYYTNNDYLVITGNCAPEAGSFASLADGTLADTDCSDGDWALAPYTLNPGSNTFTVRAEDSQANQAMVSLTVIYDTTRPNVILSSSLDPGPVNNSPIPLTIQFNETVTGFTVDDLQVIGAFKSGLTETSTGTEYTVNLTPTTDGTISVSIAAGTAHDLSGNENNVSSPYSIGYDTVTAAPTLSAPVSGVSVTNFIDINYSLPETAADATVQLTINNTDGNDVSGARVLTVAAETSGSFTLDGTDLDLLVPGTLDSVSGLTALVAGSDYNISLSYIDLAGNARAASALKSFTYNEDLSNPYLSAVSIASNNPDSARAKQGDTITLNFTASEDIQTPTVTIAGQPADNLTGGPQSFTATYTMQSGDTPGVIPFIISDIEDLAANTAVNVTATTNLSQVNYDKSGPVLTTVSISSDYANSGRAKTGNIITVNFTANEDITTPVVTIAGNAADTLSGGPRNFSATYTMTGTESEGPVTFFIDGLTDLTGNTGTAVNTTTDTTTVTYDRTSPSINTVSIISNNTSDSSLAVIGNTVSVNFSADEALQTPVVTIDGQVATVSGGPLNFTATRTMQTGNSEGSLTFTISGIRDLSGNPAGSDITAVTDGSSVTFDKTAPVITPVSIASNNSDTSRARTGDTVTVSFTSDSGLKTPAVSIAGQNAALSGGPLNWSAAYILQAGDSEGQISLQISGLEDLAGNTVPDISSTSDASTVFYDRSSPALTAISISSNNADPGLAKTGDTITLSFTSSEELLTPVVVIAGNSADTLGAVLDGSQQNWTATYTLTGSEAGGVVAFTISEVSDLASNAITPVSTVTGGSSVSYDKTLPTLNTVSLTSDNLAPSLAKTGDTITLSFSASEVVSTPAVTIQSQNALVSGGPTVFSAVYTLTASDSEGTISFSVSGGQDAAGNTMAPVSMTTDASAVTFDRTAPSLNPVSIASDNADTAVGNPGDTITLSFSADAAIATPAVTIAGSTATVSGGPVAWTAQYTVQSGDSGLASFNISSIVDLAGNTGPDVNATTDSSAVSLESTLPAPTLLTARTLDVDNNGYIDHYKLTFSGNIDDSTFPGYGGTSAEGTSTSTFNSGTNEWQVAGYNNVRIDTTDGRFSGVYNGAEDIDDDDVIYLAFDEDSLSTAGDTGAKPDLTTSAQPALTGINTEIISALPGMADVNEEDTARPAVVSTYSDPVIDAWLLRIVISESVDTTLTTTQAACQTADISTADLSYTDTSSDGVSAFRNELPDQNGCDGTVTVRSDARFFHSDFYSDTLALATTMYDEADNPAYSGGVSVGYDPSLEVYYPMDSALGDSDNTVNDVSGHGRHGSVNSTIVRTTDMSGLTNQAYQIDGTNSPIVATGYKGILGNQARTISIWASSEKPGNLMSWGELGADAFLVMLNNDDATGDEGALLVSVGNSARVTAQNAGIGTGWHHYAVTFEQGDDVTDAKMYVDGSLVTALSHSQAGLMNTVSQFDVIIANVFTGKVDEARIYSRALNAVEIKKLAVKVPDGLLAYYPLDNDGSELTGNGLDGTLNNSPTGAADRYTDALKALNFNGSDQNIQVTDHDILNLASQATVSTWAYSSDWSACVSNDDKLVRKGSNSGYALECDNTSGKVSFLIYRNSGFARPGALPSELYNDHWHLFTSTYDGRYTRFYLDGKLIDTDDAGATYPMVTSLEDLRIASRSGQNYFNGRLDDVRIYDRALSAGEVAALAGELDRGLVAYYPLDDNTTSTAAGAVKEYSGSGNDATLSSGNPVPTVDRNGNADSAYNFDGNDNLSAADTGLPTGSSDITSCAWSKFYSTPSSGSGFMLVDYGTTSDGYGMAPYNNSSDVKKFGLFRNGSDWDQVTLPGDVWPLNTWTHYCITSKDGTTHSFYVNGALVGTKTNLTLTTVLSNLAMAASTSGNSYLDGDLDEVRIYDRVLTEHEIELLAQ